MKKLIALALSLILCVGVLAGCSASSQEGKLILATSADYPPYEFHMLDENGKDVIVGIDISVARQIAMDMGLELEIMDVSFENLLTAMDKGSADIVVAAMEQDPKRELSADFSDTYYTDVPPVVVMKADKAAQFTTPESFSGLTVGAQTGTTKADAVTEVLTGAKLLSLSNVTDLINNLVYDKCDAVVLDGAVAEQYVQTNGDLAICPVELGAVAEYKVAVAEGDPKNLLDDINASIAKMVENGLIEQFIAEAEANNASALAG